MTSETVKALAKQAGITLEPSNHDGGNDWITEQEDTGQLARFADLVIQAHKSGLQQAVEALLALDLEKDGATCEWAELQSVLVRLRAAIGDPSSR